MPTMQKVQNTKVKNTVKISQVQYINEIVKDPSDRADLGADEKKTLKRMKRIPCVYQQAQSTRESQCRAKHLGRRECRQREDSR